MLAVFNYAQHVWTLIYQPSRSFKGPVLSISQQAFALLSEDEQEEAIEAQDADDELAKRRAEAAYEACELQGFPLNHIAHGIDAFQRARFSLAHLWG